MNHHIYVDSTYITEFESIKDAFILYYSIYYLFNIEYESQFNSFFMYIDTYVLNMFKNKCNKKVISKWKYFK